jgi:hypothetical protein
MSKTKRKRLNDQPIEGFADLEDELPATGAAAGRAAEAASPPREQAPAAAPAAAATRPATSKRKSPPSSTQSLPWGVLYTASVIAAGVGMGGVALLLTGGSAANSWKMGDLVNVGYYMSPATHPLNLLAMVALAVGALAALGGRALENAWRHTQRGHVSTDRLLDRLAALRLDNEAPWSDPALRDHPAVGTFAAEVLGAWRLQGARLRRVNGIEGEVVRLQKALADNAREGLTSRFDSTAVGALADDLVKFLDARNADAQELAELSRNRGEEAEAVITLVQDARVWSRATLEQIGAQGATLERLSRRIEDLGRNAGTPTSDTLEELGRTGPAVGKAAANLADVARRFQTQSDRLVRLGETVATLTGVIFDATLPTTVSTAETSAEPSLRVMPQDPFCREITARAEVDPFAPTTELVTPAAGPVLTPEPTVYVAPIPPAPVAEESFIIERTSTARPVFEQPAGDVPAPVEPAVAPAPDTVAISRDAWLAFSPPEPAVDLAATETSDASVDGLGFTSFSLDPTGDERIHELSEFGAVRIGSAPEPRDVDPDRIHDLVEFGAVRVA